MENKNIINYCDLSSLSLNLDEIKGLSLIMISHCVRAHLQNSRQGTVACKGRAELTSRSNKKPWKQKGTGKARAGTPRSPLWRGGGVVHGPQKRTRTLKVSKIVSKRTNLILLSDLIKNNKVFSWNWMPDGKCSSAARLIKDSNLGKNRLVLLYDLNDLETYNSFSNIENVNMVSYDSVHPYIMAHGYHIAYLSKDSDKFKSMVESWQD